MKLRNVHVSTGQGKRAQLARTLLHRPRIVFLDEPTSGLDPDAAREVTALIRELAREGGTTVFLCTHNLALAEKICDRFGFIRRGTLVAEGRRFDSGPGEADQAQTARRAGISSIWCW